MALPKIHTPKADNPQRALCGKPMPAVGTPTSHQGCDRCDGIKSAAVRSWQGACEAMWRRAHELWTQDGKPRVVVGEFEGASLQIVPAKFNCAIDGPRFVQVCAACYAIDENGQRIVPNDTPTAERKTNASTYIECTKAEFQGRLKLAFADAWETMRPADYAEFQEVIDGLVTQAAQHRGVFSGYNAYLDLEFTVTPDDPAMANCAACGGPVDVPVRGCIASFHDAAILPAPRADEYQPSAAITAMTERLRTRTGQVLPLFTLLITGIRAERPDWSDVQARDWLRAQLDLCADCDAPAVQMSAPEYSRGVDTTPKPRCKRHARPGAPRI